jgi:hypothetical protein
MQEMNIRRIVILSQPRRTVCKILSQNDPTTIKASGMVQVVEYLLRTCEAWSLNPSIKKEKKSYTVYFVCTWKQRLAEMPVMLTDFRTEINLSVLGEFQYW